MKMTQPVDGDLDRDADGAKVDIICASDRRLPGGICAR